MLDYIPVLEIKVNSRQDTSGANVPAKRSKSRFKTRRYSINDHEDDDESAKSCMIIQTIEGGTNSGKSTVLRMDSAEERDLWTKKLAELNAQAIRRQEEVLRAEDQSR